MFIKVGENMTDGELKKFAIVLNVLLDNRNVSIQFETYSADKLVSSTDYKKKIIYLDYRYIDGISLTEKQILNELELMAIAALAHEERHLYQYYNPSKKWKYEFDNYIEPESDLVKYSTQDIEVDANGFARFFTKYMTGLQVSVFEWIELEVESRSNDLKSIYLDKLKAIVSPLPLSNDKV